MADSSQLFVATAGILTWLEPGFEVTSWDQELEGIDLGWFSEEGYTLSQPKTTTDIRVHGGHTARTVVTDATQTISGVLMESSEDVRHFFFAARSVNGRREWNPRNSTRGSFCFDAIDYDKNNGLYHIRHWLPDAQVTQTSDLVFAGNDAVRYGFTLKAYPNENGAGIIEFTPEGTTGGDGA